MMYVVAAIAVLLLVSGAVQLRRRVRLLAEFRRTHGAAGKDLLLVYSDSPYWKEYIEATWIPRWSHRMVVLNRSKPWTEEQVEIRVWRAVSVYLERGPVAIVVPPLGSPTIVRFWSAFSDYKHGKASRLREAERRLGDALGEHLDRDG